MVRPYIGIVGVKNVSESIAAADAIKGALAGKQLIHVPQLGAQVTRTTLEGGQSSTSRRNPVVTDIPMMFRTARRMVPELFTVVHFTPKDPAIVAESVRKIFTMEDMYEMGTCRGLQLNGQFGKITPDILAEVKSEFPELSIILQLHGSVLEKRPRQDIVDELFQLSHSIEYVLIDPSGGRGQEMDVAAGAELASKILYEVPAYGTRGNLPIQVGLAGGLHGGNVGRIVGILRRLVGTPVSIDAEGGLRDKVGEGYGNDDFNIRKAEKYFSEAIGAFSE